MNNLQQATERICELKGNLVALDALASALLQQLPQPRRSRLLSTFERYADLARTSMLNSAISEHSIAAFERDVERFRSLVGSLDQQARQPRNPSLVEPLMMAAARVSTFIGTQGLTGASGFFFERDDRLYLVTSRHVVFDEAIQHFPDRIEIELHSDERNLVPSTAFSMLLYREGRAVWHQGSDSGGEVDVAVIQIDRTMLGGVAPLAFTPAHLQQSLADVEVGTPLLIVGYPLGFHDALNHLPVARQAGIASSFGIRFQGQGFFLTDARTHRGSSGAPVVMRNPDAALDDRLPWKLLGIHAARMDMGGRDLVADESLGLNCAWYADILMTLTDESAAPA
ncbi:MAG TPA: serine protease [Rubrivivax sp.]|nr:serine protease [Rubrivivax sp.]